MVDTIVYNGPYIEETNETMSETDVNKTDRTLESSKENAGDLTLQGVVGGRDAEDIDILGYLLITTEGEFRVGRDWLLETMEEVGLPEWMAPTRVSNAQAFSRMTNDLLHGEYGQLDDFQGHRVEFEMRMNDSRYSWTLQANVYIDPDDMEEEEGSVPDDGVWYSEDLGVIRYNSESKAVEFVDRIDEDKNLYALWADDGVGFKARARDLYQIHQESHTGKDITNMRYYLVRTWAESSSKIRDSVYFVPAVYTNIEDYIEGFYELYERINESFKQHGESTELITIEVMDTDRQRSMVRRKARNMVGSAVENAFDEILKSFQDGKAPDAIVDEVTESLKQIRTIDADYEALLETELATERVIENQLDELEAEKRELIEEVIDEAEDEVELLSG